MNMAKGAVKSKVGKTKLWIQDFQNRLGNVLYRIDTFYTVLLENCICYATRMVGACEHEIYLDKIETLVNSKWVRHVSTLDNSLYILCYKLTLKVKTYSINI